jgi:hypothetical protein
MAPVSQISRERRSEENVHRPGSKREQTRAALIDAAARLVAEKGYHIGRCRHVAAKSGVGAGIIPERAARAPQRPRSPMG